MRKSAVVLALALIASLGIIVPSVAAATGDPKVVIIVGATHGATAGYRADADRAYAEAIKYTPNVVKVYSPNATWAKVKAAVVGASVVIYLGHGNGWPSPYVYDAKFTTKDGFGLNATAGAGDYNNVYYGEPYIATLPLAPGAIVILNHLCYASGNSEPQNAEPTLAVARQRADNYASAFLKAGAAAVIADGHSGSENYIRNLFTTHQTIEDMWRTTADNGNVVSFASSRTPGATVFQDPMTPTSGFYRALTVGTPGVTTDEVVTAGYGDTGVDPATLTVPGNASVATGGASLFSGLDTSVAAATTLPAGTRLRVVDQAGQATAGGAPMVQVVGIDDPSISGYVAASNLLARDSAAPVVRVLDGGAAFSPNGDGRGDTATLRGRFTESVAWTVRVSDAGNHVLLQQTGTGSSFAIPWNGIVSGQPVPDGTYTLALTGVDAWNNASAIATGHVRVDTVAPAVTSFTPGADTTQWFAPNGDGFRETVTLNATNAEDGAILVRVLDSHAATVDTWTVPSGTTATPITWDGRRISGAYAPDGVYTIRVAAQDVAGNIGAPVDRTVTLVAALRSLVSAKSIFFPNDKDSLSATNKLSFTLSRPMTTTWAVRDWTGKTVTTLLSAVAMPAGTHFWTFNGRAANGSMLPRGHYTTVVTATDGTVTATQTASFWVDAFTITPSDSTPARGQSLTINVVSAEPLARTPTLYISQPGVATWHLRMTRTGTYTYKASIKLKSTGRTGSVTFKVWGMDTKSGSQQTLKVYPLH